MLIAQAEHAHGAQRVEACLKHLLAQGRLSSADALLNTDASEVGKGPHARGGVWEGGLVGFVKRLTRTPEGAGEVGMHCWQLRNAVRERCVDECVGGSVLPCGWPHHYCDEV